MIKGPVASNSLINLKKNAFFFFLTSLTPIVITIHTEPGTGRDFQNDDYGTTISHRLQKTAGSLSYCSSFLTDKTL